MRCLVQQRCGGCPNLDKELDYERSIKRQYVLSTLGLSESSFASPVIGNSLRVPYRSRIRMACVDGVAGFFNQAKRDGCSVLVPKLSAAVDEIRSATSLRPELLASASSIEVRVSSADLKFGLFVHGEIDGKQIAEYLGSDWKVASSDYDPLESLVYDLGDGLLHEVPLASFVQVNESTNRSLLDYVAHYVRSLDIHSFIDLYGGAGNHSAKLDSIGLTGSLLEVDEVACASVSQTLPNVSILGGDAIGNLERLSPADLVVCNPPRAGLKTGHSLVASSATNLICYVSCNPESLASDLSKFKKLGWSPIDLALFDMFPGTSHIETVVFLTPSR